LLVGVLGVLLLGVQMLELLLVQLMLFSTGGDFVVDYSLVVLA
jgi:hypothetical protein